MDQNQASSPALIIPHLLQRWRAPVRLPRWGLWLLTAATGAALLLSHSQWQRLNRIQEQLAVQSLTTQAQAIDARSLSQQAQILAQDAAARSALSESRINEYTLQRSHLEQLAFELSRTRDEAMLIDVEASLRLAQQQAQLTGLPDPLIAALRNARQRIERTDPTRLSGVLLAIDHDLARLTSTAVTDTAGLLGRIDALLTHLDQMPLANRAAGPAPTLVPAPPGSVSDHEAQQMASYGEAVPAAGGDAPAHLLAAVSPPREAAAEEPGTQVAETEEESAEPAAATGAMARIWHGLQDSFGALVRVQRIDYPEAALVTREQAFFLRENIRVQLLNARMGLLARQTASARSDLASVQALLMRYYDPAAPRTRQALRTLQQLQKHILSVQSPDISETLVAIQKSYPVRDGANARSGPAGAAPGSDEEAAPDELPAAADSPAAGKEQRG